MVHGPHLEKPVNGNNYKYLLPVERLKETRTPTAVLILP